MVLCVAGSETVDDYEAGQVVELEERDALRLISEGYADGVPGEGDAAPEAKPRKRVSKRAAKTTASE